MIEPEYSHMFHQERNHWWYVGMREIGRNLLPPGQLPEHPRILDAGCGTGAFMGWLREEYAGHVTGIDYSPHAVSWCRQRGENDLIRADAAELPFKDQSFDLVTSMDVLSHLEDAAQRIRAMDDFLRVLRPGGLLLVRVAAHEWLRTSHDDEILTRHRYGARELRESLARSGFEGIRQTYANSILFPGAVGWRLLKRLGVAPGGSDVRSFTRGPGWINRCLLAVLCIEAAWLRLPATSLPFGLSLFALARKPGSSR